MRILTFTETYIRENAYLFIWPDDESDGEAAVLIDPGGIKALKYITDNGIHLKYILLTHGHYDHIIAAEKTADATGAKIAAHKDEQELISDSVMNMSKFFSKPITLTPDVWLNEGDTVEGLTLIHTPGHTQGSCCYYSETAKVLFSGDTMFRGTVGRTDLYGGSEEAMYKSIREKLLTLPDNVVVYPGHNEPTTIGEERRYYK